MGEKKMELLNDMSYPKKMGPLSSLKKVRCAQSIFANDPEGFQDSTWYLRMYPVLFTRQLSRGPSAGHSRHLHHFRRVRIGAGLVRRRIPAIKAAHLAHCRTLEWRFTAADFVSMQVRFLSRPAMRVD